MLDTNILILRHAIDPSLLPDTAAISAVVLGELAAGVHYASDVASRATRLGVLQQAESEFDPYPYTTDCARLFGRMSAAVLAAGRSPRRRTADLMIAATAAVEGVPLFTTNPDDFRGLDGLVEIVSVPRPPLD